MYKIEYNIDIDENGDYLIKLPETYEDIHEHKLLYFVMVNHLLRLVYDNSEHTEENEELMDRLSIAIDIITDISADIEIYMKSNDISHSHKTNVSGVVSNSVSDLKELKSFKLNDVFDEENDYRVMDGTIFYVISNKKKYIFIENKWKVYNENK